MLNFAGLGNQQRVKVFVSSLRRNLENLQLTKDLHIQFIYNQYFNIFNPFD